MLEQPGEVDLTVQNIPVPPTPEVIKSSDEILCELFGAFNATPPPLVEITAESIKSDATIKRKVHKKHKKHTKKKQKKLKKKKRSSSSESKKSKGSNKKVCKRRKKEDSIKTAATDSESVGSKKKKRKLGKFSASDSDSDDEPKNKKKKSENHKKSSSKSKHGSHSDSEDEQKNKKKKSEHHEKLSRGTKHRSDSDSDDEPKNKKKKSEHHGKSSSGTKHRSTSDNDDEPKNKKKKSEHSGKSNSRTKHRSDSDSVDEPKNKKKKSEHCKKSSSGSKHKVKIKQEKEDCSESKIKDIESTISTVPNSIKEDIFKHAVSKIVEKVIDSTNLASEICKSIAGAKVASDSEGQQDILPRPIKQEPQNVEKEAQPKVSDSKSSKNSAVGTKPLPVAEVFAEDLLESGIKKNELNILPDKPKIVGGKIKIQNLKFSQVYEATVKQIEEEAKLKAEKYEEGELSDSSSEQDRSPTPSERSTTGSIEELKQEKEKKRHRHHHKKEKHRHRERYQDRRRSTSKERNHSSRERSHSHKNRKSSHRDRSHSKRESSHHHHRERSRERTRDRSWSREKSRDERSQDSSENSRYRHGNRSHSKDKIERSSEDKIDKQKLLEIARKNALNMMKNPSGAQEQTKVAITSGGKTVNELTDFCKQLSKKDADGHESISSNTSHSSDSESEKPFHHPFLIKDRPSSIILNIRNSVALPVKSLQEKTAEQSRQLRLQFPVSSGQHHRKTESEWVPVSPKKPEAPCTQVAVIKPTTNKQPTKVFKDTPTPPSMDIGLIVSQRLMAMRRLQENPTDMEALTQMYAAQQNMQSWAESKQLPPGQFSGSTGVKVLSQAELAAGYQAWARRDQLQAAAPVNSGLGMTLLQKMGWRPGEGLGKNKEGTLQPLLLEVKMDKKGLVAQEELPNRLPHLVKGPARSLEGKHPVSMLNEYCSRRKLGPPSFELIEEAGPDHKKNFLFKVRVNGVEYKPAVGSPKKKQARAEAAEVCLKAMGILPK